MTPTSALVISGYVGHFCWIFPPPTLLQQIFLKSPTSESQAFDSQQLRNSWRGQYKIGLSVLTLGSKLSCGGKMDSLELGYQTDKGTVWIWYTRSLSVSNSSALVTAADGRGTDLGTYSTSFSSENWILLLKIIFLWQRVYLNPNFHFPPYNSHHMLLNHSHHWWF